MLRTNRHEIGEHHMSDEGPAPQPKRQLVLVAGQGRSGTSLFTGIMHELGLHVPQPEVVVDDTNPRGFSEPQWVVDFHQRLLNRHGVHPSDARPSGWVTTGRTATRSAPRAELRTWLEEQLAESRRLIVKDPRTIWYLALWREAARDLELPLSVATMLRHPAEVVQSKQTAYGGRLDATARMAGWVNGMLFTERATRELPRTFVRYEELLADWTRETSRADRELGTDLVPKAAVDQIRAAGDLVDPDLRRSVTSIDELDLPDELRQLALEAWKQLSALADGPVVDDGDPRAEALDELRGRYVRYYDQCEAVVRSSIFAAESKGRRGRKATKPGAGPVGAPAAKQPVAARSRSRSLPRRVLGRLRGGRR
jgi:hypothetical protein